jgi:hypothetical protein
MAAPKRPASRPTPQPLSAAQVKRQVQPALNSRDKALTTPRAPQKITERDWRKG